MRRGLLALALVLSAVASAEPCSLKSCRLEPCQLNLWQTATDGRFIVKTASAADSELLGAVFATLEQAECELRQDWNLRLPETVTVRIHPTLASFQDVTAQPWFVAASADRGARRLEFQRLRVLTERHSLSLTLRHELFHLAQPQAWPRWRAEGSAMRFAGERPHAPPFDDMNEAELNARLAAPDSSAALERAAATAWLWVGRPGFAGSQ